MTEKISYEECLPDPVRISEGLRDTGYEFNTAIADIVDNSVSAGAKRIDIHINMDPKGNVVVEIADDGCGMNHDGLKNALRYGSERRVDPASLGKFGLGLKTASTAFGRRLSLISRNDAAAAVIKAFWDLDAVGAHGWQIGFTDASKSEIQLLDETTLNSTGTLVIWEKIDRLILNKKNPAGSPAKKALLRHIESLTEHLSMIYQRFLDPSDNRARTIDIFLNGEKLVAWDPFCILETEQPFSQKEVPVELPDGDTVKFLVRAFVLPRGADFRNQELMQRARLGNDMQGFYVYRENRLIHGPDWLGMYKKEPHSNLCRVELSFDHKLDEAFQVDIKKSRILLANEIYEWLRDKFLPGPKREAQSRSRQGQYSKAAAASVLLHTASNNAIHAKAEELKTANLLNYNTQTGEGMLKNKEGEMRIRIDLVEPDRPGEIHVRTVDEITNGLLFEPAFINAHGENNQGVNINTSHPYYHKVYLPNRNSSVTIQGLDSLLWALCVAEMGCISEVHKRKFEELRYEVSRVLRNLVDDMPDCSEEELDE